MKIGSLEPLCSRHFLYLYTVLCKGILTLKKVRDTLTLVITSCYLCSLLGRIMSNIVSPEREIISQLKGEALAVRNGLQRLLVMPYSDPDFVNMLESVHALVHSSSKKEESWMDSTLHFYRGIHRNDHLVIEFYFVNIKKAAKLNNNGFGVHAILQSLNDHFDAHDAWHNDLFVGHLERLADGKV